MVRDVNMPAMQQHWDIFCRVIDNYGDIGVCWRLARQLAGQHGRQVRLWVDDLYSLQPLCPATDPTLAKQTQQQIDILHWVDEMPITSVADVVIEAFACELPPAYINLMAKQLVKPCWINLEYLTAESWAETCHGMASPHPSLPLVKYFFFPGFAPSTGGLLRETTCPMPIPRTSDQLEISLFCYETAPVASLLEALKTSSTPALCHVSPGKPLAAVTACLGGQGPWQIGQAQIVPIPFLPIDDYDRLLERCLINFVRGEDSFVRAQWAGRPFVWQIYQQDDNAHLAKLEAFLDCYCKGMSAALENTVRQLFNAWNTGHEVQPAWQDFVRHAAGITQHNTNWREKLSSMPDLAMSLVKFCAGKV